MTLASRLITNRFTRAVVMCWLVVVSPVQGVAAGVFSAMGPAHIHQAPPAPLVLEDVRRWKPAIVPQAAVFTVGGHVHAGAAPHRHHHAVSDASVVHTGGDAPGADEAPSANALSVLALIPATVVWAPPQASASAHSSARWALRTGFVRPLDRPPRLG